MQSHLLTLMNAAAPRAIASSTNASPIEITMAAPHGYTGGETVGIMGHTVNTAANGTWKITYVAATKFTLDGSVGNGAGNADGTVTPLQDVAALCPDFSHMAFTFDTDGGGDAAGTIKFVGSMAKECPDFYKAQSASNQWDYIDVIDLEDGASIDGDTGVAVVGADNHLQLEANLNGINWLAAICTAGTAGEFTIKLRLFNQFQL